MKLKASLNTIEDFLAQHRIAMVGVSRRPKHFSVFLFEELSRRGYDMVPVNPNAQEILGRRCYARVQDLDPPVEAAIVMTPASETDDAVRDCAEAGIRRIWIHRAVGDGAVTASAVEFCVSKGIEVVPGDCPFMYLPHTAAVHRFHGFLRKITGGYPVHISA